MSRKLTIMRAQNKSKPNATGVFGKGIEGNESTLL